MAQEAAWAAVSPAAGRGWGWPVPPFPAAVDFWFVLAVLEAAPSADRTARGRVFPMCAAHVPALERIDGLPAVASEDRRPLYLPRLPEQRHLRAALPALVTRMSVQASPRQALMAPGRLADLPPRQAPLPALAAGPEELALALLSGFLAKARHCYRVDRRMNPGRAGSHTLWPAVRVVAHEHPPMRMSALHWPMCFRFLGAYQTKSSACEVSEPGECLFCQVCSTRAAHHQELRAMEMEQTLFARAGQAASRRFRHLYLMTEMSSVPRSLECAWV